MDEEGTIIVCARFADHTEHGLPTLQRACEECKARVVVAPSTLTRIAEPRTFLCVQCAVKRPGIRRAAIHPATILAFQEARDWIRLSGGQN